MKKVNIDREYNIYCLSSGIRVSVFRCQSVMVYTDYNDKVVNGFTFNGKFISGDNGHYGTTTLQTLCNKVK